MFSGIILIFWFIIVVLSIGCLFVVILNRNKEARIVAGIALVLVALFIWWSWREHTTRVEMETAEFEGSMVGVYELDTNRTEMLGYNPLLYHNLTLFLNEDHTFALSQNVPFLTGTKGKWSYVTGNDIAWFEFRFNDAELPERSILQFESGPKPNSLLISQPPPKYVEPQARLLYFVKKQ